MAKNFDILFTTKEDFSQFREISKNITDEKMNIFIREAQTVEVRGFLGAGIWLIMQNDWNDLTSEFTEARLNDLWFGTDYTNYAGVEVRFNGYFNSAVYFAYHRFLHQQQMNVSRFGLESIQNEISEDVSNPQIRNKAKESLQIAFAYQNDCEEFFKSNKEIYPEVETNCNIKGGKKTSFNFFKL